jgi:putative ribosome biogenesis GTPase RsgA
MSLNKLSNPIVFKKSTEKYQKSLLVLFGEMGNGKSTTGNAIIKNQCDKEGYQFLKSDAFKASKDTKAVTTSCKVKFFSDLALLDTPGFNDPEKKRTDKDLFVDLCTVLSDQ